jgi:hypothetical protein
MPEATFIHPLFGPIRFRTVDSTWVRGGQIVFLSGFDTNDIQPVNIPQLANIPGSHGGRLHFHKRAHAQVLMVFADIERLGLLDHIKTCAGSLNSRLKKPTSGALSKEPSNHAFGIAIDLNADDGSLGASVAPVAPVFEALQFKWGKSFSDPMHFEVKTFVDHPRSITQDVVAHLDGAPVDIGAMNLTGNLVADVAKASAALRVVASPANGPKVRLKGPGGTRTLNVRQLGDNMYASLPHIAGLAKLKMSYDNQAKIAHLTS